MEIVVIIFKNMLSMNIDLLVTRLPVIRTLISLLESVLVSLVMPMWHVHVPESLCVAFNIVIPHSPRLMPDPKYWCVSFGRVGSDTFRPDGSRNQQ